MTAIDLVPARPLVEEPLDVRFRLGTGDLVLVEPGDEVAIGAPLFEHARAVRLVEAPADDAEPSPGAFLRGSGEGRARTPDGEYLFEWRGRRRIAAGEQADPLDAPLAGVVDGVQPGVAITMRAQARGLRGIVALGGPSRGRLELATGPDGELRPGGLDVGLAGTILVVGSRVDAETLTRARAMGVRGIVVAALPSKDRRDYVASEARQRAALHRLPPFAVLVLGGSLRRPIASPVMRLLEALAGREVAIVGDPPVLAFDEPDLALPRPPADLVVVRSGPHLGREARWIGPVGRHRFERGVHLEAAKLRFTDGSIGVVALGDLERFV